jgi:spore coat protein CotH
MTPVNRIAAVVLLALVTIVRTGAQAPVPAPLTADDLFSPDVLHDIHLTVNSRDWQDLRDNFRENAYYLADLRWRGLVARNLGIRSRGTGSRSGIKPALRVDFDRYSSSQEFLGLKSIVLDNHLQDPSMIKERVAMRFFNEMGIPAPRVAHARLFVNNDFIGLYAIVESVDKKFLTRHFGENDGFLYEFTYSDRYGFEYLGSDLERYAEFFEPKTHERESMFELYWPIREMSWAFAESPASRFVEVSNEFLDLRTFLTQVAVESFLADYDGLLGAWGMNNFYLYRFEDATRFQLLPWDKDSTFWGVDYDLWANVDTNVLMRRALQERALREVYLDALGRCAELAMRAPEPSPSEEPDPEAPESPPGPGWLERQVTLAYEQIREAARADEAKPFDNERFEDESAKVLDFARRRAEYVLKEVNK